MEERRKREYQKDVDVKEVLVRGLIISYAFSLVLLGSYDIRRDYGSVSNYLSGKSSKYTNKVDKELPNLRWKRISKLFTKERAQETWEIKSKEYLDPIKHPRESSSLAKNTAKNTNLSRRNIK